MDNRNKYFNLLWEIAHKPCRADAIERHSKPDLEVEYRPLEPQRA